MVIHKLVRLLLHSQKIAYCVTGFRCIGFLRVSRDTRAVMSCATPHWFTTSACNSYIITKQLDPSRPACFLFHAATSDSDLTARRTLIPLICVLDFIVVVEAVAGSSHRSNSVAHPSGQLTAKTGKRNKLFWCFISHADSRSSSIRAEACLYCYYSWCSHTLFIIA